ncbi:carbohydrate binding domain-containing protein [Trichormus sp. NMC-1]|uniref:carbohydrate binding domain-containing protein n=1 Tax=Trichormus sp. NMC-1 TaxID=1853259 RepID=UPI0008DBEE3A|nr:carbohydrate binding domain-containing protein [Trichormus sp. NMC-1]
MKLSRILPLVVGGAVAGIVVSSASPAQALEFVNNGDFASGLTGWTNSGWIGNNSNIGGNSSIKVVTNRFSTNPGNLSQTISSLSVGQTYNFSFDYFHTGGTPNGIIATLGSTTLASLINTTTSSFTNFSTTFVATQTSALLNLQGYNNPASAYLDNVSLTDASTPVPFDIPGGATIPTVGSLFALGLMRQAKKRLTAKKLVVNPVETVAS